MGDLAVFGVLDNEAVLVNHLRLDGSNVMQRPRCMRSQAVGLLVGSRCTCKVLKAKSRLLSPAP